MTHQPTLTRRGLIVAGGATVVGASVISLSACGAGPTTTPDTSGLQPGLELAKLSDVAVGGTLAVKAGDQDLLLAQPSEGKVVAFSAICTHQGCVVAAMPTEFDCPCHGSRYDAATGAVLGGPAPRPLTPVEVEVSGDAIVIA